MRYPSWHDLLRSASDDVRALNAPQAAKTALSPAVQPAMPSPLEERFSLLWRICEGPAYVREFRFDEVRGWRFDFAWPDRRVAVEIEGGLYGGRHTRPEGFTADAVKYNAATARGWRVFRLTPALLTLDAVQPILDMVNE